MAKANALLATLLVATFSSAAAPVIDHVAYDAVTHTPHHSRRGPSQALSRATRVIVQHVAERPARSTRPCAASRRSDAVIACGLGPQPVAPAALM
jgi:hypothetical protein